AEDGIRDRNVTGVQTCALPIWLIIDILSPRFDLLLLGRAMQGVGTGIGLPLMYNIILAEVPKEKLGFMMGIGTMITACAVALGRSEERRVGKACRYRCGRGPEK